MQYYFFIIYVVLRKNVYLYMVNFPISALKSKAMSEYAFHSKVLIIFPLGEMFGLKLVQSRKDFS